MSKYGYATIPEDIIKDGTKMDWNGHQLTFTSDTCCKGCFFADKEKCPKCDDGIWVEESSLWHTGTPTEAGLYFVSCGIGKETYYNVDYWNGVCWTEPKVIAYMPIPPFEASKEKA